MLSGLSSHRVILLFKLMLTAAVLWLLVKDIAVADIYRLFYTQSYDYLMLAAIFLVVQIVLGGERWRLMLLMLRDGSSVAVLSFLRAQRIYYISNFFTCCLPGAIGGDVIRVMMARKAQLPLDLAAYSVLIDRLVALLAIFLFVLAMVPVLAAFLPMPLWRFYVYAGLLVFMLVLVLSGFIELLRRFGPSVLLHEYQRFIIFFRRYCQHFAGACYSLCMAVAAHACYAVSAYYIAVSLGIAMTLWQSLAIIPVIMLVVTIPVSIGGWGVREAAMVSLLAIIDVPQVQALLLSLQMGLLFIAVSLPGGIFWLLGREAAVTDVSRVVVAHE